MTPTSNEERPGWVANFLGWLSFIGLFAVGLIGVSGASRAEGPSLAGAAYLLIGGLAFFAVLLLALRRWP